MKQGLRHFSQQIDKNGIRINDASKSIVIPFHSFLDKILTNMRKYIASPHASTWAEFLIHSTLSPNEKKTQELSNIYVSWAKYNQKSLQTQLISTLLPCGSTSKLSTFLKLRKFCLKTKNKSNINLDDISLYHEDIIGVLHSSFSDPDTRKLLTQGVKNIFLSYKMQQAKIYSCVFIEYVLSMHSTINERQNEEMTISKNNQRIMNTICGFSSIYSGHNNHDPRTNQNTSNFQSLIHEENGLYRKVKSSHLSANGYTIIDRKFTEKSFKIKNDNNQNSVGGSIRNFVERNNSRSISKINHEQSLEKIEQAYSRKEGSKFGQYRKGYENYHQRSDEEQEQVYGGKVKKSVEQFQFYDEKPNNSRNYHSRSSKGSPHSGMRKDSRQESPYRTESKSKFSPSNNSSPSRSPIALGKSRNSKYKNSGQVLNSSASRGYSEKFKSPDMDYNLTPGLRQNSRYSEISPTPSRMIDFDESPSQRKIDLNLIKIEQQNNSNRHEYRDKEGGYSMWKRMSSNNQQFKEKMLRNEYETKLSNQEQNNINMIRQSIVRHGEDRWADPRIRN